MNFYTGLLFSISLSVLQCACSQPIPNSPLPSSSLLYSDDAGITWQSWKSDLPDSLHVSYIDVFGERIVIATESQAMYISDASGGNWQQVGIDLPSTKINALSVRDFIIYASVYREGIYRSVDAGKSWEPLNEGLPNKRLMAVLKIDDRLIAGGDDGIVIQMDGKDEWLQAFEGEQVVSLQIEGNNLIAGCTAGVLLSQDFGETWEWIQQEGAIHNTAIFDSTVLSMYIDNRLFVSQDLGTSWTSSTYTPRFSSYVYDVLKIDSTMVMSNNYGIHRSIDGGITWTLSYPTEELLFFDFLVKQDKIFAGMRVRNEFRD